MFETQKSRSNTNSGELGLNIRTHASYESIQSVLKFMEIIILKVYYIIPIGFSLFRHLWVSLFNF